MSYLKSVAQTDDTANFRWQIGRNANPSAGVVQFDGAVRETGTAGNNSLSGFHTQLRGGVLEIDGSVGFAGRRLAASGVGNLSLGAGGGGFSAHGSNVTLSILNGLSGNAVAEIGWEDRSSTITGFTSLGSGVPLLFGSSTANATLVFQNGIRMGTPGTGTATNRVIQVVRGVGSGPEVDLAGNITQMTIDSNKAVTMIGDGRLRISNATNTFGGATFNVYGGTLLIGASDSGTVTGTDTALGNASKSLLLGDTQAQSVTGNSDSAILIDGAFSTRRNITVQAGNAGNATLGGNAAGSSTFTGNVSLGRNARLTAASNGTVVFSGSLSGNGGITKVGPGLVELSNAANTFLGATAVDQGNLRVTGTLNGTSGVTVNNGATLSGNGVVVAPVVSNGTLSPGISFGNLTIGNYTQVAGGALTIEIGARPLVDPTLWDHLFVAGNAILDGVLNIIYNAANNFTGVVGDIWKFVATTGTRTGNFATATINATGLAPNTALQVNYLTDGVELQLVSTGNNSTVTYDTWKLAYWPTSNPNDDWNDDSDADGNNNLVEYALDTDPLTPDLLPLTVGESGGNLTLWYTRPGGANYRSDLNYVTQRTTDLSGTSTLNTDTPTGSDADPTNVSVPSTTAYGSVDREFLDLRIEFTAAPAP